MAWRMLGQPEGARAPAACRAGRAKGRWIRDYTPRIAAMRRWLSKAWAYAHDNACRPAGALSMGSPTFEM